MLIFPLLACAGYTDSFLYDLNNGSLSVFISRCSKKQYYFSKLTAVFISGFAVIVFAQCFNMLLCMIAFPVHSTNLYSMDLWQAGTYTYVIQESFFLFKELYIFSPYLYFIFYIFISGLAAGLVAVIAFQLSFFVKNRIIVISFMFVVINLLSVFLESRNIGLDICSYMIGYNPGAQSYRDFVITFVLYSIFAVMPTFFAMKRLNNCI